MFHSTYLQSYRRQRHRLSQQAYQLPLLCTPTFLCHVFPSSMHQCTVCSLWSTPKEHHEEANKSRMMH